MSSNNLNYVMPAQDKADFMNNIDAASAKISFAKNIEFPKKAHRRKMGTKREGLMQMVNTAVNSNQSILPNGYDLDGFNNDVKLLKDINEMLAKNEAEIRQPLLATKAQVCHQIMKNVDNAHGV